MAYIELEAVSLILKWYLQTDWFLLKLCPLNSVEIVATQLQSLIEFGEKKLDGPDQSMRGEQNRISTLFSG